ncbi:protein of unknown function [Clostridium beijerinckii]|nr:protein of unknown function [Clostridium beijerinckii]
MQIFSYRTKTAYDLYIYNVGVGSYAYSQVGGPNKWGLFNTESTFSLTELLIYYGMAHLLMQHSNFIQKLQTPEIRDRQIGVAVVQDRPVLLA